MAFANWRQAERMLDVGCGYGRLADEARACGVEELVGVDFSTGFARHFSLNHGAGVCSDLTRLPFVDDAFSGAYVVTALMYLDGTDARSALLSLSRCVAPPGRILLIEPGAEFNHLVRRLLRRKAEGRLVRPGFTALEFEQLAPASWRCVASGSNRWMTLLFPLLAIAARMPRLYACIERIALKLDRPHMGTMRAKGRLSIYRWAVYETAAAGSA
jgi:SAM-dependent methyltransferase